MKHVLLALTCVGLAACSSTADNTIEFEQQNQQTNQPAQELSYSHVKSKPKVHAAAINNSYENAINQWNWGVIEKKINLENIISYLSTSDSEVIGAYPLGVESAKVAPALKKSYMSLLKKLSKNESSWLYLNSDEKPTGYIASHYRVTLGNDAGYVYVDLVLDPEEFTIVDVKNWGGIYSSAELMVGTLNSDLIKMKNQSTLSQLYTSVQNGDALKLKAAWLSLDERYKRDKIFLDVATRIFSENSSLVGADFIEEFISYYPEEWTLPLSLESYYLDKENFAKALECLESLPPHARGDSKMLSEQAAIYMLMKEYEPAWQHSQQAILADPYDTEAYFIMLQISLATNNHKISSQLLHLLEKRFNMGNWEAVMKELKHSETFVQSEYFTEFTNKPAS